MRKNLVSKVIAAALTAALAMSLTACGSSSSASTTESSSGDKKTIGVIQYTTVPSLDNCYEGFVKGLADEGFVEGENLTIDFQNANAEVSTADTEAQTMAQKKYDLIGAIATPAAMSAYGACKADKIPVVFTAVSDPVSAQLVKSLDKSETICAGSSDQLPLEAQLQMIRAFLPEAKKIGVLYTTSEPNSITNLETLKELAPKYDFESIEAIGVTNSSEIAAGAESLVASGVDCINNFTDNNVVNNLPTVLQAASKANIPVFGSEEGQVYDGCLASISIDYVALGEETGKIAGKILKEKLKPEDSEIYTANEGTPFVNTDVAKTLGIEIPSEYQDGTMVTTGSNK
ncbi:putative ABC transport system substrate-binding protein [Lachnospiraceae bacterium KH1T2]|nr:putative ABC transport system substrate-binding protein [Lachnospiraceae bacterium KH1T2]